MRDVLIIVLAVLIAVTWDDWGIQWTTHIGSTPVMGHTFDSYQTCVISIEGWKMLDGDGEFSCRPSLK